MFEPCLHPFFILYRTPFRRVPQINGHEIDLYLLYVLVTAHGGWFKVSRLFCFGRVRATIDRMGLAVRPYRSGIRTAHPAAVAERRCPQHLPACPHWPVPGTHLPGCARTFARALTRAQLLSARFSLAPRSPAWPQQKQTLLLQCLAPLFWPALYSLHLRALNIHRTPQRVGHGEF